MKPDGKAGGIRNDDTKFKVQSLIDGRYRQWEGGLGGEFRFDSADFAVNTAKCQRVVVCVLFVARIGRGGIRTEGRATLGRWWRWGKVVGRWWFSGTAGTGAGTAVGRKESMT